MSARALPFVFIPLVIMIVAILLNGSQTPNISQQGNTVFCANPGQQNCINSGSTGTLYYCDPGNIIGFLQACKILPSCSSPPYPSPAFCIGDILTAIGASCGLQFLTSGSAGCGVYLSGGNFVFITTIQIASSLTSSGAFFSFSASASSGFIGMIGIAVGIISLLGLTVFGSGEQGEGLHILFIGGMVMGLWLIISALEGYPGGSEPSPGFFGSLNVAIAGLGTFIYVMLTLSVVAGFTGLVSRGA